MRRGLRRIGSLMPMKKLASSSCSATGPPLAPSSARLRALLSKICAVKMPVSKATICATCSAVGAALAWAWPSVASTAWLCRLGSRPSHMMPLMKPRLVEGDGRREVDVMPEVGPGGPGGEPGLRVGVAVIGIVDRDDAVFGVVRNRNADAGQSLVGGQLVGAPPLLQCRHLVGRTGGPVDQAEERIGAARGIEARGRV